MQTHSSLCGKIAGLLSFESNRHSACKSLMLQHNLSGMHGCTYLTNECSAVLDHVALHCTAVEAGGSIPEVLVVPPLSLVFNINPHRISGFPHVHSYLLNPPFSSLCTEKKKKTYSEYLSFICDYVIRKERGSASGKSLAGDESVFSRNLLMMHPSNKSS